MLAKEKLARPGRLSTELLGKAAGKGGVAELPGKSEGNPTLQVALRIALIQA